MCGLGFWLWCVFIVVVVVVEGYVFYVRGLNGYYVVRIWKVVIVVWLLLFFVVVV